MTPIDFQNAQGIVGKLIMECLREALTYKIESLFYNERSIHNTVADHPPKFDANGRHQDPIEFAGLYEGDIILKSGKSSEDNHRNAIINSNQRWPQGQVPYVISSDFSKTRNEQRQNSDITNNSVPCHYKE